MADGPQKTRRGSAPNRERGDAEKFLMGAAPRTACDNVRTQGDGDTVIIDAYTEDTLSRAEKDVDPLTMAVCPGKQRALDMRAGDMGGVAGSENWLPPD